MSPLDSSRLRHEAVRIALNQLGYGERFPKFLPAIGARPRDAWCAVLVSYCYSTAAANLKLPEPAWARKGKGPVRGAKRIVKNMGAVGSMWKPGERTMSLPLPGDLVCWNRGVLPWTGHVGIITEAYSSHFCTVEGNVGEKVVFRKHTYTEPKLWRFASLEP